MASNDWPNLNWEQERGVMSVDYNISLVLARASVEEVAQAMTEDYLTRLWERDVLGRFTEVSYRGVFIFRLRGHIYTQVLVPMGYGDVLKNDYARSLSKSLQTRVIEYGSSDTACVAYYSLFQSGKLLETFEQESDYCKKFVSRARNVNSKQMKDVYQFVDQFFKDQNALEPGIGYSYFWGHVELDPGTEAQVQNPWFISGAGRSQTLSKPQFERVDYVVIT